ncbi:extracellular calcium-sensing receptor-like [Lissotriton helveticus]
MADFFRTKVTEIFDKFNNITEVEPSSSLNNISPTTPSLVEFNPPSLLEIKDLIKATMSGSPLDPCPPAIIKLSIDVVAPILENIFNTTCKSGNYPQSWKSAIIKPLLKKPTLDTSELKSYRPIAGLPFPAKILEKISYFATSPLLSDRKLFPAFFRTIPSDDSQSRGLAQLLIHFGWTWVGLLADDSDYGQQGIEILKQELDSAGACVAFSENIMLSRADRNAFHIVRVIKNTTANAIVIFSLDSEILPIIEEVWRENVTGKIWIASESWSTSPLLLEKKYSNILNGTIGFAIHSGQMPGFDEFLNSILPLRSSNDVLLRVFWEQAFDCKWMDQMVHIGPWNNETKLCTGEEKLDTLQTDYNDATSLRVTYNVYTAVYTIAMALHNLLSCKQGEGPFLQASCAEIFKFEPWQLLHYIQNVHYKTATGDPVDFDKSGNPLAQYDIINWQMNEEDTLTHVKVGGYYSSAPPGESLLINVRTIQWPTNSRQVPVSVCSSSCLPGYWKSAVEGKPVCCFQCVPCPPGEVSNLTDSLECTKCLWDQWPNDNHNECIPKNVDFLAYDEHLGVILAAISIIFSMIPAAILGIFFHQRNTPIVKANNRSVSYLLLLSLIVCFLCSLTFIGYPTPNKCLFRQATFGITFAVCVSCILAKTIMVVIAFNATKPNSKLRRWVGPKLSYMIIFICSILQAILCVTWLLISPPFSQNNIHTQPWIIIVECNEGSSLAFWCMLGYLGLLAMISFIVAFLARKLPDTFNEAKCITFSILAFLSVWISFIPAYLSTKGKYMVAMEIFAILTSSLSLVFCIFFPKCYIILLRPGGVPRRRDALPR